MYRNVQVYDVLIMQVIHSLKQLSYTETYLEVQKAPVLKHKKHVIATQNLEGKKLKFTAHSLNT